MGSYVCRTYNGTLIISFFFFDDDECLYKECDSSSFRALSLSPSVREYEKWRDRFFILTRILQAEQTQIKSIMAKLDSPAVATTTVAASHDVSKFHGKNIPQWRRTTNSSSLRSRVVEWRDPDSRISPRRPLLRREKRRETREVLTVALLILYQLTTELNDESLQSPLSRSLCSLEILRYCIILLTDKCTHFHTFFDWLALTQLP